MMGYFVDGSRACSAPHISGVAAESVTGMGWGAFSPDGWLFESSTVF